MRTAASPAVSGQSSLFTAIHIPKRGPQAPVSILGRPSSETRRTGAAAAGDAPALIVIGHDDKDKPHAAWFGQADTAKATEAATLMQMQVVLVAGDDLRALANQLPQGKLFTSGKAFVPFVKASVYEQIAAHAPELVARPRLRLVVANTEEGAAAAKADAPAHSEAAGDLPEDWSKIKVGNLVLATEGKMEGWYEAIVTEAKPNDVFWLKWRDWPDIEPIARHRSNLALLCPPRFAAKV